MKEISIKKEHLNELTHTLKHAGGKTLTVIGSTSINVEHNGESIDIKISFPTGVKT